MRLCYSLLVFMSLLVLISAASLVAGCGKKGALYIPTEPQTKEEIAKQKAEQAAKQARPISTEQP